MNIFKRLFKKKEIPKESQDWYNRMRDLGTQRTVEPIIWDESKLDKDGIYRVKEINKFPTLTKQEALVLKIIFTAYPFRIDRPSINRMYRKDPSKALLNLVTKGYIRRPQKGWYTLTFVKYD